VIQNTLGALRVKSRPGHRHRPFRPVLDGIIKAGRAAFPNLMDNLKGMKTQFRIHPGLSFVFDSIRHIHNPQTPEILIPKGMGIGYDQRFRISRPFYHDRTKKIVGIVYI
jgi:hypothetical protein